MKVHKLYSVHKNLEKKITKEVKQKEGIKMKKKIVN